jgi:hypothetical protein
MYAKVAFLIRSSMGRTFVLVFLTLLLPLQPYAQTPEPQSYADSADGFRQQLEDLVATKKSGDDAAFREKLKEFAIPKVNDWISAHFSPTNAQKLQSDYGLALLGFQTNLTDFIDKAEHSPVSEITVWQSEPSIPPREILSKNSLPSPVHPTAVEFFRYGLAFEEDVTHRTWVSSFLYLEGSFRYVGGVFPYWWGPLQHGAVKAPQIIPASIQNTRRRLANST